MRKLARARAHPADLLTALFVAALLATAQYEVWIGPIFEDVPGPRGLNAVLLTLVCVPLLWRRSRPVTAFAVVIVAIALQAQVETHTGVAGGDEQGTLQSWLAALVAFYSLGAHAPPRRAAFAGAIGLAGWILEDLRHIVTEDAGLENTVPAWFLLAAAWGLGYALHGREAEVHELRRDREAQARAAVAAERERIARELHDVIAHSLSVMVVQAQAADRVLEGEHPSAREALASIDATGRQALTEMRRLVGMLREQVDPGLAPQPGLGQLDALIERVGDAGLPVDLVVEGPPRPLAPGVDLAAYRIVQEALTNALKHAGPATARVVVRYGDDDMELEVADDGRGARAAEGNGHGLAGMRERVAVYGGMLESGPRDERGFLVRARLPT
jgi:signal transduction histidine kinase